MRMWLLFFALFVGSQVVAEELPQLATELEAMFTADQALREEILELEKLEGPDSEAVAKLWEKQTELDGGNIQRLLEIIERHGWRRIAAGGRKAALAAFLVVQHAEPSIQKQLLPILRKEAAHGEVKLSSLALLEDRVLTSEGKPQLYGSQLHLDPECGKMEFFPIQEEDSVNARRASVGLEPIEDYARRFGLEYKPGKDG